MANTSLEAERLITMNIIIIMSKCVNYKVYTVACCEYGNSITQGNTPVGVLPHDS